MIFLVEPCSQSQASLGSIAPQPRFQCCLKLDMLVLLIESQLWVSCQTSVFTRLHDVPSV